MGLHGQWLYKLPQQLFLFGGGRVLVQNKYVDGAPEAKPKLKGLPLPSV